MDKSSDLWSGHLEIGTMAPVIEIRVPRRRHFGLVAAAVVTVAAVAAAAPASP
jgi:hypothetical protein